MSDPTTRPICCSISSRIWVAILDAIDVLPTGLTTPAGDNHALRLDYVRGDLFDTTAMRDVAPARSAIRTSSTIG